LDTRRRLVAAYESGLCKTYEETAKLFAVGVATVSRNLRRKRETGDVLYRPKGHARKKLDREWLARHAEEHPDATQRERAEAWEQQSGIRVTPQTVSNALREIGWTYKKRRPSHASATAKPTR
jgi:transposase